MHLLETLFYTFVALGVLVTIHEFGHFWVARRCGVKVERFSIGFGTPIVRWRDKFGTEFVIAVLPLGGYVKMVDARDGNVADEDLPHAFSSKSVWRRIAIVSAGPLANFALAIVAFWMIFLSWEVGVKPIVGDVELGSDAQQAGFESGMTIVSVAGRPTPSWGDLSKLLFGYIGDTGSISFQVALPDSSLTADLDVPIERWLREATDPIPLRELGITPAYELQALDLAMIEPDSAADRAGLMAGDTVMQVNGEPIERVDIFIEEISRNAGQTVVLQILRGEAQTTIEVIPDFVDRNGEQVGQIGVQLAPRGKYPDAAVFHIQHGVFSAMKRSWDETADYSVFIVKSLGKLLTGDLSPKNLSGPITIAKVAGDSGRAGFDNFIRFVAILSIMLGVMNLMPIPVLDGGHLVYFMVEVVKGSPVSDSAQIAGYKVGFVMLVGLMLVATFNDLTRAFL